MAFEAVSVVALAIAAVGSEEASVAAIAGDSEVEEVELAIKAEVVLVEEADTVEHRIALLMAQHHLLMLLLVQVVPVEALAAPVDMADLQ